MAVKTKVKAAQVSVGLKSSPARVEYAEPQMSPSAKAYPTVEATETQSLAIQELRNDVESLIALLQPHLPEHFFDNSIGEEGEVYDTRVSTNSNNSATVNAINRNTNAVDDIGRRINWLRAYIQV